MFLKYLYYISLEFIFFSFFWSKQLSSVPVYRASVFDGFSGHSNSIHSLEFVYKYRFVAVFPVYTFLVSHNPIV